MLTGYNISTQSEYYFHIQCAPLWFLSASEASPVCLSGKGIRHRKMRVKLWWNDTDRGGSRSLQRNPSANATSSITNFT
jgi:hypothetical protein